MKWAEMARSQTPARHKKREELKKRFIAAVEGGAALTKNGVVSRGTYLKWKLDDPEFAKWLSGVSHAKPGPPKQPAKPKKRIVSVIRGIFTEPMYVKASRMINRYLTPDVRESAISELMLMMLSGEEPDAGRAVRNARAEFSQLVGFEADLYSESVWDYGA